MTSNLIKEYNYTTLKRIQKYNVLILFITSFLQLCNYFVYIHQNIRKTAAEDFLIIQTLFSNEVNIHVLYTGVQSIIILNAPCVIV